MVIVELWVNNFFNKTKTDYMNNDLSRQNVLERYFNAIQKHDYSHMFSDDDRAWRSGKQSEDEIKELFNNLTTNFDGINFIYFLSKFKEISGKNFIKFLHEKIKNIDNIIYSEDSINPDFEFLTVMTNDVATLDAINIVMNAMTKSYGGVDGYSQMQIKQDSRNQDSEWMTFNEPDANIVLNAINRDGETINFDYTTRTKIINDLEKHNDWMNGYIILEDYEFVRDDDMKINKLKF